MDFDTTAQNFMQTAITNRLEFIGSKIAQNAINYSLKGRKGMAIYDYNGKKNICGPRIREARKRRKLTQTELAAKVQTEGLMLDRDSLCRIEGGYRFVSDFELKIFAEILGVSILWLLTGHD